MESCKSNETKYNSDQEFSHKIKRRDARVAEWAGFENRCRRKSTEGSTPSFSAIFDLALNSLLKSKAFWFESWCAF